MSLEMESWKQRGGFGQRGAEPPHPPTTGDRVARAVAVLILLVLFALSIWSVSLVLREFTFLLVSAMFMIFAFYLGFRLRELNLRLAAIEKEVRDLETRPPPVEPAPPVPPPPPR
jgi:hypothetical protein